MKMLSAITVLMLCGFILSFAANCKATTRARLVIYHAGSLSLPFERMVQAFEARFPRIEIIRKSGGSTKMAKLISVDREPADIMVSADYTVIDTLLIPEFADWNICFATNQLVLCYTDKSRYAAEVNENNWHDILARKDVAWGHSDPDLDPCGYRSLMVLQLAERYYGKTGLYDTLIANRPKENILPKATALVGRLKAGQFDYAWEYLSVAVQNGLKYVALPDEINLGNSAHDPFYSQASVRVAGKKAGAFTEKRGKSCTYGVTLLKRSNNNDAALAFLSYLLDPQGGLKLLSEMGQPSIIPCRLSAPDMASSLPANLGKWVGA